MNTPLLLPVLIVAAVIGIAMAPHLLRQWRDGRRTVITVIALVIPVGAISALLYTSGENRPVLQRIALHEVNPHAAMRGLAQDMRQRLDADPEGADARGYFLLGRTLGAAGDRQGAIEAYAEANRIADDADADLLVAEAEARLNDPERSSASHRIAERRIAQALEVAPGHPGAHFYAGALALGEGDEQGALPHLRAVLDSDLLEGGARQQLAQRIEQISRGLDEDAPAAADAAQVPSITVTVAPHEGMAPPRGGTLFVFLRQPDGPPMPLAARRVDAPQWPVTVRLRDSDRLSDGPSLFGYEALDVVARWSEDGDALSGRDGPQGQTRIRPDEERALDLYLRHTPSD